MRYFGLCKREQHSQWPLAPLVPNLTIRASWDYLEPQMGHWQWDRVDAALAALPSNGVAAIWIKAGSSTPAWVLSQCAETFTTPMPPATATLVYPAPWDSTFLNLHKGLIKAVGLKYGKDKRIVRLLIPTLMGGTDETNLNNILNAGSKTPADPADQPLILQLWLSVGYTPTLCLSSVQQNVAAMKKYIPNIPSAITWKSGLTGLDFDLVQGHAGIQAIHNWYITQPNCLIYNCGASANWVMPPVHGRTVYQEAHAQKQQKLFDQLVSKCQANGVSDLEIYAPDLPLVH